MDPDPIKRPVVHNTPMSFIRCDEKIGKRKKKNNTNIGHLARKKANLSFRNVSLLLVPIRFLLES